MNEQPRRLDRLDWAKLTDLSAKIANVVMDEGDDSQQEKYIASLLSLIDSLLNQYGRISSLLAIKADFVHGSELRFSLYEEAYILAEENDDFSNMQMILDSVSEMKTETSNWIGRGSWGERIRGFYE